MSKHHEVTSCDDDQEEVAPRPAALIESLRSFGYTPATAIADLLDNSVTAGSSRVDIKFAWAGRDSSVSIFDDGSGMTEDELRAAMRAGSSNPLDERSKKDLGRFGLGLKTASFSQARSLTVASKAHGATEIAVRRWDLDHVGRENRWSLLKSLPSQATLATEELGRSNSGTLVLWHELDRIVDDRPEHDEKARSAFFATVDRVKEHLEMVFHRFLASGSLVLTVNGQPCVPWDPFFVKHAATEKLQPEVRTVTLNDGRIQKLNIQPYVLPHRSAMTADEHKTAAGPRGWNLQQGFYLYRAGRLIVSGDWFDPGVKPEEHFKLARVCVEITQEMDHDWALDVRKSTGRPPGAFREDFRRIARATRERAQDVYRHHGRQSVGKGARSIVEPVWLVRQLDQIVAYEINRKHPIVERLLEDLLAPERRRVRAMLSLIEKNIPSAHILSQGFSNEASLGDGPDEIGAELLSELSNLFNRLCAEGLSDNEARTYLLNLQPFDSFPETVEALDRDEQV